MDMIGEESQPKKFELQTKVEDNKFILIKQLKNVCFCVI